MLLHESTREKIPLVKTNKSQNSASKRQALDNSSGSASPHDIWKEWELAWLPHNDASSEEENDFMTPVESFSKSNKKSTSGKWQCSSWQRWSGKDTSQFGKESTTTT